MTNSQPSDQVFQQNKQGFDAGIKNFSEVSDFGSVQLISQVNLPKQER